MGLHDDYGKRLLREAAGARFEQYGPSVEVDYGAGSPARIDGTVGGTVAVEIDSREPKQVRGSVVDLLCHRYPKKLLLLLPVQIRNPEITASQCRNALGRYIGEEDYRVVALAGHGKDRKPERDVPTVRAALRELGGLAD